jgi:DNA-binding SARP family transcriptional activator/tetratricopeptide (TPR) repeat protein
LELRLIGELVVAREGIPLALPASKKTRALLAYLAATGRPQLRERLCALLWDGPDDPRAALRWSLTKLRPLVDDRDATRLVADRDRVELVANGATIDLAAVRSAVPGGTTAGVARASTEALAAVACLLRGELLEGLEMPDCYRFDEWLRSERETVRRLGVTILATLVARGGPPATVLDHARSWVGLDPLDEAAHAAVIRLLVELDRKDQALAQYASCSRLIERELGRSPSRELERMRIAIGSTSVASPVEVPVQHPVVSPSTPLVGRVQECAALARLIEAPERPVLLLGDPGIGKTRLLDELVALARTANLRVLRGRGVEAEQVRPYGAWLDAFADAGASDHPFTTTVEAERSRLFEAVVEWLVGHSGGRGLVLVIDDLQWIDEATAALLHFVARSPRTASLVRIACGARPGELSDNPAALRFVRGLTREGVIHQIGLSPLDAQETAALAVACSPGVDGARVFAESGGHPLFAVEIAHALTRGDTSWASLEELLADRLELLEGSARDILPWAAAIGVAFSADVLGAVTGLPLGELSRAIADLERRAIVRADGTEWDFVHDLVRAAAYRRISEPRRRLLHLQIARSLAALPDPDGQRAGEVARHAGIGDDSALCANASITAATRALRLAAPEEALALCDRGLAHAVRLVGRDRARLQIGLLAMMLHADVHHRRHAETGKALERAIVDAKVAGCHGEAARGLNELSHIPFITGNYEVAHALSLDAVERVRDADATTQAHTLAFSAQCIALIGREMEHAEQLAREAVGLLAHDDDQVSTLPFAFGLIRDHQGDAAAAITHFERAVEIAQPNALWWVCALCWEHSARIEIDRGRPREALVHCEAIRAHAELIGDGGDVPLGEAFEVIARWMLGETLDIEPTLARLRAADAPLHLAFALTPLAELELRRGDLVAAARYADEAIATSTRAKRASGIVLAHGVAAQIARADGRDEDVRTHVAAVQTVDPAALSARARAALAELVGTRS